MTLCFLTCTRYQLTVPDPRTLTMAHLFAPVPQGFRGRLRRL
ncbi:hypothetical protein [Streptomyces sp. NPDC052496]